MGPSGRSAARVAAKRDCSRVQGRGRMTRWSNRTVSVPNAIVSIEEVYQIGVRVVFGWRCGPSWCWGVAGGVLAGDLAVATAGFLAGWMGSVAVLCVGSGAWLCRSKP